MRASQKNLGKEHCKEVKMKAKARANQRKVEYCMTRFHDGLG